jgi:hypothetical protein
MKKMLVGIAACIVTAAVSFAGLDMYTGKTFKTILAPTVLPFQKVCRTRPSIHRMEWA